jgi:general secretion pathway protein G
MQDAEGVSLPALSCNRPTGDAQLAKEAEVVRRIGGFSLIELLIVLTMLALIAAIAVPRLVDASQGAKESVLATDLQMLRRQIQVYKMQHGSRGPHLDQKGNVDKANLSARLTGRTDPDGRLDPGGSCGPYMKEWPTNPFSDSAVAGMVLFGTDTAPPRNDTTGWYYNIDTCLISPNSSTGGKEFDPIREPTKPTATETSTTTTGGPRSSGPKP